jgi:cell division septal protein FtsQ
MTEKGRKRRGNSRFIIFFILILMVLSGLSWVTYRGLGKADWLRIRNIAVAGNQNVSMSTIQELLENFVGENLVQVSSREVKKQLYKIKRIERVKVIRQYPATLKVRVYEKQGFLYLKSLEGDLFPIDEKGRIMEYAIFPADEDLPIVHTRFQSNQLHTGSIVREEFVKNAINLQKKIASARPDFLKYISEYYQEGDLTYIVDAKYGTRILLGERDIDNQLRRYTFVQENGDINRKDIVDLRFSNQVVVRPEVR